MKRALLLGGAVAAMLGTAPFVAFADDAVTGNVGAVQVADTAAGEVDAGKLIGQDVYDANGDKVGDIESVMVDQEGKVNSVVLDVSGWLESEKLIAVKWTDLKTGEDGKIVSEGRCRVPVQGREPSRPGDDRLRRALCRDRHHCAGGNGRRDHDH
jgi:sporulation protein YlmC with PRC-barrel domain